MLETNRFHNFLEVLVDGKLGQKNVRDRRRCRCYSTQDYRLCRFRPLISLKIKELRAMSIIRRMTNILVTVRAKDPFSGATTGRTTSIQRRHLNHMYHTGTAGH